MNFGKKAPRLVVFFDPGLLSHSCQSPFSVFFGESKPTHISELDRSQPIHWGKILTDQKQRTKNHLGIKKAARESRAAFPSLNCRKDYADCLILCSERIEISSCCSRSIFMAPGTTLFLDITVNGVLISDLSTIKKPEPCLINAS